MTGTAGICDVLLFTGLQGIGTGLLSTLCYAYAVRALGSNLAATAGAISPVLTALIAIPLFDEHITPGVSAALTLIVTGVTVFNIAPRHRENGPQRPLPGWRALGRTRSMTNGMPPTSAASTSEVA
jgi:drug/metabolite transporter (DMT)-like permease